MKLDSIEPPLADLNKRGSGQGEAQKTGLKHNPAKSGLNRFKWILSPLKTRKIVKALKDTGIAVAQFVRSNKINKTLGYQLGFVLILVLIPWISEVTTNKQVYTDLAKVSDQIDPIKAGQFAEDISKFTPAIDITSDNVTLAEMVTKGYTLSQQLSINDGKTGAEPERQAAVYEVGQGETITQIAAKFNLHVGSILDANSIDPSGANQIKPGTSLNIPSSDTNTSDDWLVAVNKAEADDRAKAATEKQASKSSKLLASSRSRTSTLTSSGSGDVDNGGLIVPISSMGISQGFGRGGHTGIDYMADIGTSVRAAASGKVVKISSGWSGGYGNQILIDHGNGRVTRYAHLSGFNVSQGESVNQGESIGYSGSSGRSTGPHLHFELILNGRPVNPF